jgi:spermidine synthase
MEVLMRGRFLTLLSVLCFSGPALGQSTSSQTPPQWELLAAFACVVVGTIVANAYVVGLFHAARAGTSTSWTSKWEFSPGDLGGFSWLQLALWSLLSLFLELLMIRWISSEIRIFAYFKNFVLIACFLGFGLGCYLSRRRANLLATIVPVLTLTMITNLPWRSLHTVTRLLPDLVAARPDDYVWGVPVVSSISLLAAAIMVIVPIFALVAFSFIPLGQMVGWHLENACNGVAAYSVNIAASLAGILFYTLLCFFYQPPPVWFAVAGLLLVCLLWRLKWLRIATAMAFVASLAMLTLHLDANSSTYWSPYQKLTLIPRLQSGETIGYTLNTNDSWYQQIYNLSPEFVSAHPQMFRNDPVDLNPYNFPYRFYAQPPTVLILGSGMGNDVAAALRNGAGRVTAVEIDPLILKLGKQLHFEKPYSSPRVRAVQDDARSYVQNSKDRFDLIVFSLLDSHTTSSHFTNIRIDNYVYTLEALEASKQLLQPDGIFVVKIGADAPWIAGRLDSLLTRVFGHAPLRVGLDSSESSTGGRFFIIGSEGRIARALSDAQLAAFVGQHSDVKMSSARPTTDDWPYFYQRAPGLPLSVIVISVALMLLFWTLLRDTGVAMRSLRWHFFFLGAGFLLLEAQIISKIALLFGTIWVVNSIVIAALLSLIVGANFLVNFNPHFPVSLAYGGIFLSLLVSYSIPLQKFFFTSLLVKILAATLVLCLPVFFAGTIFIRSFASAGFRGEALGSNLFGAMVGGILESASLWTGIRFLLVIAALLYLASWIALRLETRAIEAASAAHSESEALPSPVSA